MNMLLLAVLGFSALKFSGGGVEALAHAIHVATNQDVVIATASGDVLEPFDIPATDRDTFVRSIRKLTRFTVSGGLDMILGDGTFVAGHFPSLIIHPLPGAAGTDQLPRNLLDKGKVTLDTTAGKAIYCEALMSAKFSKPVHVSWLLRDEVLGVDVANMPEQRFLNFVAKAVGGELTQDNESYSINLDTSRLSDRLLKTIPAAKAQFPEESQLTPGGVRADPQGYSLIDMPGTETARPTPDRVNFFREFISILPETFLAEVFSAQSGFGQVNVPPNSPLASACVEYIRSRALAEEGLPKGYPVVAIGLLSRIDNRAFVHLKVHGDGQFTLAVPAYSENRQSSSYIDL